MDNLDYWKECIEIASIDCELKISDEQILFLAEAVQGGFENFDTAFGYDVADKNFESEESIELKKLKKNIEKHDNWLTSTKPCTNCNTTGIVHDRWGRGMACYSCCGKGRI